MDEEETFAFGAVRHGDERIIGSSTATRSSILAITVATVFRRKPRTAKSLNGLHLYRFGGALHGTVANGFHVVAFWIEQES